MTLLDNYKLHATLISTLYHLVKIYFAAITHYTSVVQMQREHSSLVLLKQGDYRELTEDEVRKLMIAAGMERKKK